MRGPCGVAGGNVAVTAVVATGTKGKAARGSTPLEDKTWKFPRTVDPLGSISDGGKGR